MPYIWVVSKHPVRFIDSFPSLHKLARPDFDGRHGKYGSRRTVPIHAETALDMITLWMKGAGRGPPECISRLPRWEGYDCIPEYSWIKLDDQVIVPAIEASWAEGPSEDGDTTDRLFHPNGEPL